MAFSCKIILSPHAKVDGTRRVYLQAIIDRQRADIPLDFYVQPDSFDARRQCMKKGHPNAKDFDSEFFDALSKSNSIASRFRMEGLQLTPTAFRTEYLSPTDHADFIKFMQAELQLKRPSIAFNTYKQHNTVINKLKAFRKVIPFSTLNPELVQQFRNELIKSDLVPSTINKLLKVLKYYCDDARKKGHKFKDPFLLIRIKHFKSNRLALTQNEVHKLDKYFKKRDTPTSHKKLLRYFLFSCYTGVRISDIKLIKWKDIHDDLLIFIPAKTKGTQKEITIPLRPVDKKYLPKFTHFDHPIFETFTDQVSNRYIKDVAKKAGIQKKISYHTSRHTFGSLFAEGGNIVALQKIMGHGDIKTTMGYVHSSTEQLIKAKKERFG